MRAYSFSSFLSNLILSLISDPPIYIYDFIILKRFGKMKFRQIKLKNEKFAYFLTFFNHFYAFSFKLFKIVPIMSFLSWHKILFDY